MTRHQVREETGEQTTAANFATVRSMPTPTPLANAITTLRERLEEIRPLVAEAEQLEDALMALEEIARVDEDAPPVAAMIKPKPAKPAARAAKAFRPLTGATRIAVFEAVKGGARTPDAVLSAVNATKTAGKRIKKGNIEGQLSKLVKGGYLHRPEQGVYVVAPGMDDLTPPPVAKRPIAKRPAPKAPPAWKAKKAPAKKSSASRIAADDGRQRSKPARAVTVDEVRAYVAGQEPGTLIRLGSIVNALEVSRSSVDAAMKQLVDNGEMVRSGDHLPPTSAQRGYVQANAAPAAEEHANEDNGNAEAAEREWSLAER